MRLWTITLATLCLSLATLLSGCVEKAANHPFQGIWAVDYAASERTLHRYAQEEKLNKADTDYFLSLAKNSVIEYAINSSKIYLMNILLEKKAIAYRQINPTTWKACAVVSKTCDTIGLLDDDIISVEGEDGSVIILNRLQ
ncbi:MAG: hypothetical protein LBJ61_01055 [Deltaproteobacteria bacterium]|jgi:hypothetical protein|nr:hypothetical protein [Deltaproteobacteria bacterium]